MQTLLKLSIAGFPPLSARGCVQELKPIQQTHFTRTLSGELISIGHQKSIKYQSKIHCEDKTSIATEGLIPGSILDVECVQRLWQRVACETPRIRTEKKAVPSSIAILDAHQNPLNFSVEDDGCITLNAPYDEEYYISYRPKLHMMVKDFSLKTDEWGMVSGWRLDLEEV